MSYNQSIAKMVSKKRGGQAEEARLKARQTTATKAIAISSAALGILTLGFLAYKKTRKKKNFFS